MKASECGESVVIGEAADLIDSGVAVGLWDKKVGSGSVRAITNKDVMETLVRFSAHGELVIPLTSESGLVALEVTPNEGGVASLGTLLDKGVIPTSTPIVSTAGEVESYLLFRFDGQRTKPRVRLGAGLQLIADQFSIVVPPRSSYLSTDGRWKQGHHPAEMSVADLPVQFAALLQRLLRNA